MPDLLRSLWSAYIHHDAGNCLQKEVDITPACNLLTRTGLIKKIGGFYHKLANGEDKLACLQIRGLGYKIFLDSRFGVLHHQARAKRAHFLTRVRINFRDIAFIYGATGGLRALAAFHGNCALSLWPLYKNYMEMLSISGDAQDLLVAGPARSIRRLIYIGKILVQYVLANKTYMSMKGYGFRLARNPHGL